MEFGTAPVVGLWSREEASWAADFRKGGPPVLWGCDGEEAQPGALLRELARKNPDLAPMAGRGYRRALAPEWLERLRQPGWKDVRIAGEPVLANLTATLEYEQDRLRAETRLQASRRREELMKELIRRRLKANPPAKVLVRFGRNHLHRGYDRRGVSTLGNHLAELASAQDQAVFNVAAFAAGGQIFLGGALMDFDERPDDPAFALLASQARFDATVFDLRPLRQPLHGIPERRRTHAESSLTFWADSYDSILCYRRVTPLAH